MASSDPPAPTALPRAPGSGDAPAGRHRRVAAESDDDPAWRPLVQALMRDAEEERGRIAAHVHAEVEPLLITIKLTVDDALHRLRDGAPQGAAQLLAAVPQRLRDLVEDLRVLANSLQPSMLHERGLLAALEWQSDAFAVDHPGIGVVRRLTVSEAEVPRALRLDIYRIAEQALANVAQHSGATWVRIGLFRENKLLHLLVEDNGVGFEAANPAHATRTVPDRTRTGLVLVRQRLDASGGRLLLRSMPRQGTQLRAVWPLPETAPISKPSF